MEAVEYIQTQVAATRRYTDAVMQDTTDEQFNWLPPGLALSMKASLMHQIANEDNFVQAVIQGRPRLWETEGWSERLGLARTPGRGGGWEEIKDQPLQVELARAYLQSVRTATDSYLAGLTREELERSVTTSAGQRQVAQVLATMLTHATFHTGEMATLKGLQGAKGLPF